jgi:acyl-ACP thioesterase
MRTTYRESFKVRSYETDTRGRLQAPILCQLLEQSAVAHAALLGVAVESLIDSGVAWVLSRLHLEMERWPKADEGIEIETWPEAASRLFTERRFEIRESTGRRIGSVSTLWFVLNLERRRPIRLPQQVTERLSEHEIGPEPRKFGDLDVPEPIEIELGFTVRRSDLDLADHVNNTSYVEWTIEAVPDEVWEVAELAELEIHYLSECHHGQTVVSRSQVIERRGETEVRHQLVRSEDDVEVARARTLWRGGKGAREQGN